MARLIRLFLYADDFAVEEDASKLPDSSLFLDVGAAGGDMDNSDEAESEYEQDFVKTRKRRKSREPAEDRDIVDAEGRSYPDSALLDEAFPKHFEAEFATAIFELGLKNSSPKVRVLWVDKQRRRAAAAALIPHEVLRATLTPPSPSLSLSLYLYISLTMYCAPPSLTPLTAPPTPTCLSPTALPHPPLSPRPTGVDGAHAGVHQPEHGTPQITPAKIPRAPRALQGRQAGGSVQKRG